MSAKVWKNEQRGGDYYLVDRHHSHKNGRKMVRLGRSEEDRLRCEQMAEVINAERCAQAGRVASLQAGRPLLGGAVLGAWWDAAQGGFGDAHRKNAEWLLRTYLVPHFASTDLRCLTREHIKSFAGRLADTKKQDGTTLGHHTVHNALSLLRRALNWLDEQPALQFRIPVRRICMIGTQAAAARGARRGSREAWTRDEAARLLEIARSGPLYPIMFAALHTGARKGELLALEWQDVYLDRGLIAIRKNLSERGRVKETKSLNSRRHVEISDELRSLLAQMAREQALRGEPGRVFRGRDGRPWNYLSLGTAWRRLRRRAHGHGVRPLQFHCWRHSYVSWALQSGADPAWVAKQIGDRLETMLRHYAHFVPGTPSSHDFLRLTAPESAARSPHLAPRDASAPGA